MIPLLFVINALSAWRAGMPVVTEPDRRRKITSGGAGKRKAARRFARVMGRRL